MKNKQVPWKQALSYTIERALHTYDWMGLFDKKLDNKKLRILADIFSVYVTTLVDGGTIKLFH